MTEKLTDVEKTTTYETETTQLTTQPVTTVITKEGSTFTSIYETTETLVSKIQKTEVITPTVTSETTEQVELSPFPIHPRYQNVRDD